jgi:hypothetical protein
LPELFVVCGLPMMLLAPDKFTVAPGTALPASSLTETVTVLVPLTATVGGKALIDELGALRL